MIALSRLRSGLSRAFAPGTVHGVTSPAIICSGLALVLAAAGVMVGMRSGQFPDTASGFLSALLSKSVEVVAAAFEKAPALVMVLIALLVVPIAAVGGLIVDAVWSRRSERKAHLRSPPPVTGPTNAVRVETAGDAPWPAQARLHVDGSDAQSFALSSPVVRIGRHEENDVRLAQPSVHRYHAIVHRTPQGEYHISDLSGASGNGVLVNGARHERHRLTDGDAITLGGVTLRFSMRPL